MSNLLKRSSVINKDERVIDYNDLIKKKIQTIMESKHNEMDADGFINGLHADVVEELISDDGTADALTDDAAMGEQQAAASLENANAEAERIIEEARLQAEQIIADANKNADAAFEEAKQNGYYEGNEKAQEEMNIKQAQLEAEFDNKRKEPPGYKENAGIFCHNNPWVSIAETVIDDKNRAFETYKKICPAYLEEISEIHRTEPYVYSQMIAGKDAASFGEAKNSWLTGTAAWTFTSISQYILGVRASFEGLTIDPCLPDSIKNLTITRKFRDAVYNITIINEKHERVSSLIVNGSEISGNTVPYNKDTKVYNVTVNI